MTNIKNQEIINKLYLKLEHFVNFIKKRNVNRNKEQAILSDYFYRFLNIHNKNSKTFEDKLKLIDCIKGFYKDKKYQDEFNNIIKKFNFKNLTETNRLLLIQSVYVSMIN